MQSRLTTTIPFVCVVILFAVILLLHNDQSQASPESVPSSQETNLEAQLEELRNAVAELTAPNTKPARPKSHPVNWMAEEPKEPGVYNMRIQGGWVVFTSHWATYVPQFLAPVAPVRSGS